MISYFELWGTWLGAILMGVPFTLWFVHFLQHYSFYLNDKGYISLISHGINVFVILFSFAWGSLIGYSIHTWILKRRTKLMEATK